MFNTTSFIQLKFRCAVCSFINNVDFKTILTDSEYTVETQTIYSCTKCHRKNEAKLNIDKTYLQKVIDELTAKIKAVKIGS